MSKRAKRTTRNIFEPVAVYEIVLDGPSPIKRPVGSTQADAWRDLRDVGRRLSLAPLRDETLHQYALRLRTYLSRFDRREYVGGALVAMLLHIVNLDCPPSTETAISGKDQP